MRRAALTLVLLAACSGKKPPMTVNCELEEAGAEIPAPLRGNPWLLHDLRVADKLPRNLSCVIRGRTREKVWSEEPGVERKTDHPDGMAHIIYKTTDFSRGQKELVIRWSDGSKKVPLPALARIDVAVDVDGEGVAHITGTVDGTDKVKLAGEPVTVTDGKFAADIKLASWVFEHVTVADLPLDPLPSTLTLLIEAGEGDTRSYAMATMPAPQEQLVAWVTAVLAQGSPVPYAPPADFEGQARPMVVVFWDETPTLKSLVKTTPIGAVEAIAHVRAEDGRVITLYSASDGVELARETFNGREPDETEIMAWLSAHASPLPKPKRR